MSTDAQLMYDMCVGIVDGEIPEGVAKRTIGQEFSARWITFGTRFIYKAHAHARISKKQMKIPICT